MTNTLHVSNLPLSLDSSMLEDIFTMIGNVRSAQVLLDVVSGANRRFGLVEMSTEDEAQDCIRYFNGQIRDDNALVVRENTPHIPLPPPFKKVARVVSRKKELARAARSNGKKQNIAS